MKMSDEEILQEFCQSRNHSPLTENNYRSSIRIYTKFNKMSLYELLNEAEEEEIERLRWKEKTLRKRLINFRKYLLDRYLRSTALTHLKRITAIYDSYEIELQKLPYISPKQGKKSEATTYEDIPDEIIIKKAIEISKPLMTAIILFITSSGSAKSETLSLTIQSFIDSLQDYTQKTDIYEILDELGDRKDIIPTFKIKRNKINEYYYTFCSPEATTAIFNYLLSAKHTLTNETKLFKTNTRYLNDLFGEINENLNLGKVGKYNRFRTHMLRKFHSTRLDNAENLLTERDIDFLQGRSDSKTRQSYFFKNKNQLKIKYAKSLNAITVNKKYDVLADDDTLELFINEYDPEKEIKPLKQEKILLKKENKRLIQENEELVEINKEIQSNIQEEAKRAAQNAVQQMLNGIMNE